MILHLATRAHDPASTISAEGDHIIHNTLRFLFYCHNSHPPKVIELLFSESEKFISVAVLLLLSSDYNWSLTLSLISGVSAYCLTVESRNLLVSYKLLDSTALASLTGSSMLKSGLGSLVVGGVNLGF